jgi:hypothetical protein
MTYDVQFRTEDGETKIAPYDSDNPGSAFAKCLVENPGCQLLQATARGKFNFRIDYEPPPVQRDPVKKPHRYRAPKPNERVGEFPFYDEAKRMF